MAKSKTTNQEDDLHPDEILALLAKRCTSVACKEIEFCRGKCCIKRIGGESGFMNILYKVWQENTNASVILKRAPLSNEFSLLFSGLTFDPDRMKMEYLVLAQFHQIVPGCVPKPYDYDEQSKIFVMEDLHDYVILPKELIAGKVAVETIARVAHDLGVLHKETSQSYMGTEFDSMEQNLANSTQVKLLYQFTMERPFRRTDPSNKPCQLVREKLQLVFEDKQVLNAVQYLKKLFCEKKQCLIHGDVHSGSVMVNGYDVKLIDGEFGHIGAAAFDIGTYVANLMISYHAHRLYPREDANNYHQTIKEAIKSTVRVYLEEIDQLQESDEWENLVSEIAGFTGLQLVRRTIGMSNIQELKGKPDDAELAIFLTGINLLKQYTALQTKDSFIECLFCTV